MRVIYSNIAGKSMDDDFFLRSSGGIGSSRLAFSQSSFTPSDFFTHEASERSAPFLPPPPPPQMDYAFPYSSPGPPKWARVGGRPRSPPFREVAPPTPPSSESKLSRENLRLDLPTLCLNSSPPPNLSPTTRDDDLNREKTTNDNDIQGNLKPPIDNLEEQTSEI